MGRNFFASDLKPFGQDRAGASGANGLNVMCLKIGGQVPGGLTRGFAVRRGRAAFLRYGKRTKAVLACARRKYSERLIPIGLMVIEGDALEIDR